MNTANLILTESDRQRLESLLADMPERYREADPHLKLLQENLKTATVVASEDVPPDVVTMNSCIANYDDDWDVTETCTLVYPEDSSIFENRLSVLNPMGMAIIGRRSGDTAEWTNSRGVHRLRLREVVFQPERAGVLDLY